MAPLDAKQQATRVDENVIPVIDVTPLRDGSDPAGVGRALHAASRDIGFIYIKGHGIPDDVIEAARSTASEFFRQDTDTKKAVKVSARHRGWLDAGDAIMVDDGQPDLKESFVWGYQDAHGHTPDDSPLRGPNQWPDFLPDMQEKSMAYFHHAHEVANHLMRGFALGLGLDEQFFLQTASQPLSRASYVSYPAHPEDSPEDLFGVGPHTDFGVLTVLCQDSLGGLQVRDVHGDWIEATPIEGTLIVNVGDLLTRWTGDGYRSTPHRVVNMSGQERLSLVLAYDPDPDTMIDARDVCGANFAAADAPITCSDYLVWRFAKAFSYRRDTANPKS
jgi:isopenicillin N synthase-like dioxygenase